LIIDDKGDAIDNPTVQVHPIFNGGTTKQFFKWYKSIISLMEEQLVGEHYRLSLQALRGTYKALWKRELDLASPKLAVTAIISNDAVEKQWYDSIMKLTIHAWKDTRGRFKQVSYMEHYLWIGQNTCKQNFMDRLGILSTYLPHFPPLKDEVFKELSDIQKAKIFNDTIPHYYIKKMKEANTEPIEMTLEELFQFALNIEETVINPGKDSKGNTRSNKERKSETAIHRKQGVEKSKVIKREVEVSPPF
jgi:hypothetical protein